MNTKVRDTQNTRSRNYNKGQSDSLSDKENQKFDPNIIRDDSIPKEKVIKAIKSLSSDQFLINFDADRSAFKDMSHLSHIKLRKPAEMEETKDLREQDDLFKNLKPLNYVLKEIQGIPPFLFFYNCVYYIVRKIPKYNPQTDYKKKYWAIYLVNELLIKDLSNFYQKIDENIIQVENDKVNFIF